MAYLNATSKILDSHGS